MWTAAADAPTCARTASDAGAARTARRAFACSASASRTARITHWIRTNPTWTAAAAAVRPARPAASAASAPIARAASARAPGASAPPMPIVRPAAPVRRASVRITAATAARTSTRPTSTAVEAAASAGPGCTARRARTARRPCAEAAPAAAPMPPIALASTRACLGFCYPHCQDNQKDADETDVDCGGVDCPTCAPGLHCKKGTDCSTTVCRSGSCGCTYASNCPSKDLCLLGICWPHCNDNQQDVDETGVDCGGADCPLCPLCSSP